MKLTMIAIVMALSALTAWGDLNSWNDGTNANIRVSGVLAQSITNTALTASRVVTAGSDKSLSSVATTALITGAGAGAVAADVTTALGYTPVNRAGDTMLGTLTVTGLTITNSSTTTVPLVVQHASGGTSNAVYVLSGGTNIANITGIGAVQASDGTSAIAGLGFLSEVGTGLRRRTTAVLDFIAGGNIYMEEFSNTIRLAAATVLSWASSGDATNNADTQIGRDSASTVQLGADAASPVNQALKAADGSGTDKNGGNLTIEGGQSTGTGTAGGVIIRTAPTSTTGSSANAYQDRARYVPKYVALTDNTATSIFTVTLPATNMIGMTFTCTVQAGDGTDFQSLTTPVTVDAVAKTTTITAVVAPTAAQTALAGSGGTLSVTYTVVDAGSNLLAVKCTADTSFASPTFLRAKIVMTGINIMGAGTVINEL